VPYSEYLRVLLKRWWLIPLVGLVAAACALAYSQTQTPIYRSTARLIVSPGRADFGQVQTVREQLRPMAQRVKTSDVARQVDQEERLDLGPERLLASVKAEAALDQGLIVIESDDTDPQRAERIAGAFAQIFAQQQAAADLGKPLAERLIVDVLDQPSGAVQIYPQTRVQALAALLLGLLTGLLLVFGLEYVDNTLKTDADIQRELALSTLARIPTEAERGRPAPQPSTTPANSRGEQRVT
jgi:capsular polysaccharide biosynthesis protein